MARPRTHIEVEGDKPKVERTLGVLSKELIEKFPSVVVFSVRVLRPHDDYPYERAVWESEIRAPVDAARTHVEAIAGAWVKTMEAGLELARANAERPEPPRAAEEGGGGAR